MEELRAGKVTLRNLQKRVLAENAAIEKSLDALVKWRSKRHTANFVSFLVEKGGLEMECSDENVSKWAGIKKIRPY